MPLARGYLTLTRANYNEKAPGITMCELSLIRGVVFRPARSDDEHVTSGVLQLPLCPNSVNQSGLPNKGSIFGSKAHADKGLSCSAF